MDALSNRRMLSRDRGPEHLAPDGAGQNFYAIDRGLRELPIQADYVGRFTPTTPQERVKVVLGLSPAESDEIVIAGVGDLGADSP